jgi:hypothetical protein
MKEALKKTYYCDFCKKHLHRKPSMEYHEKHCTANLDRVCGLCGRKETRKPSLKVLVRYFRGKMFMPKPNERGAIPADEIRQPKLEDIMESVEYCPICTLTIIRGCGLQHFPYEIKFDFKREMEEWWKNKWEEEYQAEMQGYY